MTPKIGQYLYATCSAEDYGKIVGVGKDANDVPTIDIELNNPSDILWFPEDDEVTDKSGYGSFSLATVETESPIILRFIQYKELEPWDDGTEHIECHTPGNNCYRCTKHFLLHDKPA